MLIFSKRQGKDLQQLTVDSTVRVHRFQVKILLKASEMCLMRMNANHTAIRICSVIILHTTTPMLNLVGF